MKKRKVLVVSPNPQFERMFHLEGWGIANTIKEADLIQFTGGSDISASLYGEEDHPSTHADTVRDKYEIEFFNKAREQGKAFAGVCRGGQLLNVLSGGKLYQHVNNHNSVGTHKAYDIWTREIFPIPSIHHQLMRPSKDALILLISYPGPLSTFKEIMKDGKPVSIDETLADLEAVYYKNTNSLCFQSHPEYSYGSECKDHYFRYIIDYLFDGEE